MRELSFDVETWPISGLFAISRGTKTEATVVTVAIRENGVVGRGECVPYARYGEAPSDVVASIRALSNDISQGLSRADLQRAMPRGAARNALDCALWDLEAKLAGKPVWALAELSPPHPVTTAYTLSLGDPASMHEAAKKAQARPLLKVKLGGGPEDIARVAAVREGAPNAKLIVDANEAWSVDDVLPLSREMAKLGVTLIEQPLPMKQDEALRGLETPVPFCADESVHGVEGMLRLVGLYGYVNIKLDKTGGLTEALSTLRCAKRRNLGVMVGCMVATSLAMAPALLIAQQADYVDLDGPLLLEKDRDAALHYDGSLIYPPSPELWG